MSFLSGLFSSADADDTAPAPSDPKPGTIASLFFPASAFFRPSGAIRTLSRHSKQLVTSM